MAHSICTRFGTGATDTFTLSFSLGYLQQGEVSCMVAGESVPRALTFLSTNLVRVGGPYVANGLAVNFYRTVPKDAFYINFDDGDVMTEENLAIAFKQNMMATHEALDAIGQVSPNESRALRVPPGETITDMPSYANMQSKLLFFDELRRPVGYDPDSVAMGIPGVDTVGTIELKIDAVETENIKNVQVTEPKIADASLSTRLFVPDSIPAGILKAQAVTLANINFGGMRIPCQANVEFYVIAGGNDSGPGTLANPLGTIAEAWHRLRFVYDGRGFTAKIWVIGLGNTPADLNGAPHGFNGSVVIEGYGTSSTISTWYTVGFSGGNTKSIQAGPNAHIFVRRLTVGNSAGHGLVAWWNNSILEYENIAFATCNSAGNHIWATQGGMIEGYNTNVIIGPMGAHISASHGGRYRSTAGGGTGQITYLINPITMGLAFAHALNGEIVLTGTPSVGGAFNPNGVVCNGPQWTRIGYAGAIQSYGLQTPASGDFMGSIAGSHGPNT